MSTVSEKIPEMWLNPEDVTQRILIANFTISGDVPGGDTLFFWKLYNGTEILEQRRGNVFTEQFRIESQVNLIVSYISLIRKKFFFQHTHQLTVEIQRNKETIQILTKTIEKSRNFWISALGDSFSSGQGNPDLALTRGKTAKWLDGKQYHKAAKQHQTVFQNLAIDPQKLFLTVFSNQSKTRLSPFSHALVLLLIMGYYQRMVNWRD